MAYIGFCGFYGSRNISMQSTRRGYAHTHTVHTHTVLTRQRQDTVSWGSPVPSDPLDQVVSCHCDLREECALNGSSSMHTVTFLALRLLAIPAAPHRSTTCSKASYQHAPALNGHYKDRRLSVTLTVNSSRRQKSKSHPAFVFTARFTTSVI